MPTRNLKAPVPVVIFTPPSYDASPEKRYPVLYFLHDGGGDEAVLFRHGVVAELDKEMRAGTLPEMILVCPRGVGTWWVDAWGQGPREASFLSSDLVPFVESHLRTRASKGGRLVAGVSMGGYGALRWALAEPERFAAAGGVSPAIQQLCHASVEAMPFFVRPSLENVFGADPVDNVLRQNDLYQILLDDPSLAARVPFLYVRVGTEDRWRLSEIAGFFDRFASALGVPHEVKLETGVHEWSYWRKVLPDVVKVLAARLAPSEAP